MEPIPSKRTNTWSVYFDSANSALTCRHQPTGATISGVLTFERLHEGKQEQWTIVPGRDGINTRLGILDTNKNTQGYVTIRADDNDPRLCIGVIHRAAQNYSGRLTWQGEATLGTTSFACRSRAPKSVDVVQMASGPADSALNDSLFDINTDTIFRFQSRHTRLTSSNTARNDIPVFGFKLTASPERVQESEFVLDIDNDFYKNRYVPFYSPIDKTKCPTPPTGWMSWNIYFDAATEEDNLKEARFATKYLQPYGLNTWLVESWQEHSETLPVSDFHNLTLNSSQTQFPHGMKWLADEIRNLGFAPGIWTYSFGTGSESFYNHHKSWFLHDENGSPMSNWNGRYVLDPSQQEVLDHMCTTHRTMSRDWGYVFFKVDGMSGRDDSLSAHFFERDEVREAFLNHAPNAMDDCVKKIREGIGEDRFMLACQGHYTGPEAFYADAARIGADIVHPGEPAHWENVVNQARTTLNQLFVHNIVWYIDPDTLMVGSYHHRDIARVATSIITLPGSLMVASDKLADLPPDRLRLLQQALPVCDVRPLDLFPIFEMASVWDLKIARDFGTWDVVSIFNWSDSAAERSISFKELGLAEGAYLVFDFWEKHLLGSFRDGFDSHLSARSNRLYAIHLDLGRPQFVSTDRHISQGGTSLADLKWDAAANTLSGECAIVANDRSILFIHIPDGWEVHRAMALDAVTEEVSCPDRNLYGFTIRSDVSKATRWSVVFGRI